MANQLNASDNVLTPEILYDAEIELSEIRKMPKSEQMGVCISARSNFERLGFKIFKH